MRTRRATFCNGDSFRFACSVVGWGGIPLKPKSFSLGSRHASRYMFDGNNFVAEFKNICNLLDF
jgi:hypothetical protein